MNRNLPYHDIFFELLEAIHKALWYCHEKTEQKAALSETDIELNLIFEKFSKLSSYRVNGLNSHLIKGLTLKPLGRKKKNLYPRLSKLVVYAYKRTQEYKSDGHQIIPSPLNILYHALTVPEEPQTAAYAFVLCRSMLLYFLKLHPKHPELSKISPGFDEFREEDIAQSISSLISHNNIQSRWPGVTSNYQSFQYRVHYLNGHILSLKGYTYLKFNKDASKDLKKFLNYFNHKDPVSSLIEKYDNTFQDDRDYHFKLSGIYHGLPDVSEINNWIFGVPVPLRGADLLFYGGLKKTSNNGLVISIHGQPGAGKTSAALSLAAVLSPLKTKTFYLSLEENPEDLKIRLNSLIPDYLRRLSIFENNYYALRQQKRQDYKINWFTPMKFSEDLDFKLLTKTLEEFRKRLIKGAIQLEQDNKEEKKVSIPAVCPLLIVIDNVNELFAKEKDVSNRNYADVEHFIDQCRNMGAFVVLIAADDIPQNFKLDYMVDVSMHLGQEGLDQKYEKPVRVIQLLKTRHQVSRQGSHVFHLSSSKGFRISPQVPSQLDKREKIKIELPSTEEFIHTLNLYEQPTGFRYEDFLPIASHSQILIHGHGSTGKAGFGLKLLLTPLMKERLKEEILYKDRKATGRFKLKERAESKVLVISFLYPKEYYEFLHGKITSQFSSAFDNYIARKNQVDVKSFYPGYLTPEDFVYKIVRWLEQARLEGEPYTGILLDGLHNVFLQFKYLQEAHMVWPLLYSMLYRYSLTVVTTFTNFSLNGNIELENANKATPIHTPGDFTLFQQGQRPFLHGLVKAADYFFMLEETIGDNSDEREYRIAVRSSIKQTPPLEVLKWDREKLSVQSRVRVNGDEAHANKSE